MDPLFYEGQDPNDLLVCPYDVSHQISVQVYPGHVIKCRRQHKGPAFAVCPYNARHELHRTKLSGHLKVCPDKAREVHRNELTYIADKDKGCTDVPDYYDQGFEIPKSSEDWDEEIGDDPSLLFNPNRMNDPTIWYTNSDHNVENHTTKETRCVAERRKLESVPQKTHQGRQPRYKIYNQDISVTGPRPSLTGHGRGMWDNGPPILRPLQTHNAPNPAVRGMYQMKKPSSGQQPFQHQNGSNPPGKSPAGSWAAKLFK